MFNSQKSNVTKVKQKKMYKKGVNQASLDWSTSYVLLHIYNSACTPLESHTQSTFVILLT